MTEGSYTAPPRRPAPSKSKTGKVLSDAEHRQRKAAAEASARRRRRMLQQAKGPKAASSRQGRAERPDTTQTSGLGNSSSRAYVNTDAARSAFISNGVSGADVNQRREPKSGFLVFSGKSQQSHQQFVNSLNQMGFMTSIGADGSGIAINAAGQALKIGAAGNSAPTRRRPNPFGRR